MSRVERGNEVRYYHDGRLVQVRVLVGSREVDPMELLLARNVKLSFVSRNLAKWGQPHA